jgi:hypothetical protein
VTWAAIVARFALPEACLPQRVFLGPAEPRDVTRASELVGQHGVVLGRELQNGGSPRYKSTSVLPTSNGLLRVMSSLLFQALVPIGYSGALL